MMATLHAMLRDFFHAHALMREALALSENDGWLYTERAFIHQQALEDARHSVALGGACALSLPVDHGTDGHRARVAFGAASSGDHEEARKLLAAVNEDSLSTYERFVARVTQAFLIATDAAPEDVEARYGQARNLLSRAAAIAPDYRKNRFSKRAWNRATWQVARMRSRTVLGAALKWISFQCR
jgi:hypothetical protein